MMERKTKVKNHSHTWSLTTWITKHDDEHENHYKDLSKVNQDLNTNPIITTIYAFFEKDNTPININNVN